MALYKATAKLTQALSGGQLLERGMSVQFSSFTPPWGVDGGKPVNDAFLRVYGIDLKANHALGPGFIEVVEVK